MFFDGKSQNFKDAGAVQFDVPHHMLFQSDPSMLNWLVCKLDKEGLVFPDIQTLGRAMVIKIE